MKKILYPHVFGLWISAILLLSACGGGGQTGAVTELDSDNDGVVNSQDADPENPTVAGIVLSKVTNASGVMIDSTEVHHHANGNTVYTKDESFYADGTVVTRIITIQNSEGKPLTVERYSLDTGILTLKSKSTAVYNANGFITLEEEYERINGNLTLKTKTKRTFTASDLIASYELYELTEGEYEFIDDEYVLISNGELKLTSQTTFSYDSKDQLLIEKIYSEDGGVYLELINEYDHKGNKISETVKSTYEGSIKRKEFSYDNDNNSVGVKFYENDVLTSHGSATFDGDGNLLTYTIVNADSEIVSSSEVNTFINGVRRKSVYTFDLSRNISEWDAKGRIVLNERFTAKGVLERSEVYTYTVTGGVTYISESTDENGTSEMYSSTTDRNEDGNITEYVWASNIDGVRQESRYTLDRNEEGRPIKVVYESFGERAGEENENSIKTYSYDSLGREVKSTYDFPVGGELEETTTTVYLGTVKADEISEYF